jgi:hypothetical protein
MVSSFSAARHSVRSETARLGAELTPDFPASRLFRPPLRARHLSNAVCRGPAVAMASANPEAGRARLT